MAGVATQFTIDTMKSGKGKVEAILVDPNGASIQVCRDISVRSYFMKDLL